MRVVGIALLLALLTGTAQALTSQQLLTNAIRAYDEAQSVADSHARAAAFDRAYRLFIEAAARGADNGEVYANAGTAALRAQRPGPAILAFRRALEKDPQNARARLNLILARGLLPAWLPKPEAQSALESFFFWRDIISKADRAGVASLAFLLTALALSCLIIWPKSWIRSLCTIPALIWLALLGLIGLGEKSDNSQQAVVVAAHATARASDSVHSPTRFSEPLPEGTELEIVELRNDWARVRLADNREAWVALATLERLGGESI